MDTAQRALPKSDVPKMDMRNASFVQKYVSMVIYDRVRNKKNNFENTAFLNYERGTSRAGNSKSNQNKQTKTFLFSYDVLNFPALDFPRSICRKTGISK